MKKRRFSVRDMCLCALFSALLAICAWISIPVSSVPVTLQTFGIFLALLSLGGFRGTVSIFLYLCLGFLGLPVFSGFRGGLSMLALPSGGFLIGFLLSALVYWAICAEFAPQKWGRIVAMAIALVPCYGLGLWWMFRFSGSIVPPSAYFGAAAGFLIPDCLKFALAWYVARHLKRFVSK